MRPLVLISNDDGVHSPHLVGLADALAEVVDVLVVAPERQRSAASHAITLHKPLRLTEVAPRRFSLSGTPVDCVYLGLRKLADRAPALVVSGINEGFNLGTDVFYSGTVAAAVEGALRGSVGIALSLQPGADAGPAVRFAVALCQATIRHEFPPGQLLNVNVPTGAGDRYAWTQLGRRRYDDDVTERLDPRGRPYYWIGGGPSGHDDLPASDCNAVAAGMISVTPMHLDLTARAARAVASDPVAAPAWVVPGFQAAP
ncbi:MAG: 5'/3'-nucleotidase SurE [Kofleriaceae bacterium]|nr:5'/3'-nucleotidase SurE [Kofleriaceae bacterium]MBP6840568.1 5'/3'-nucleotidase SurE [Kofleriaceae bacterium]MBP9207692.1 5'/3'-nucleotidase SurE [Kofleriaceae bacterium]